MDNQWVQTSHVELMTSAPFMFDTLPAMPLHVESLLDIVLLDLCDVSSPS
jgi:hypothetical protein